MLNSMSEKYYRSYWVGIFSWQHFYCLLIYYLIIAIPFYFCFGGLNFWLVQNTKQMNVIYQYTGFYALEINYSHQSHFYTNIPRVQSNSSQQFNLSVQDTLSLANITLTFQPTDLNSVNLILYYNCSIPDLGKYVQTSLQLNVLGAIHSVKIAGSIKLELSQPLSALQASSNINYPAYYPYQTIPTSFKQLASYLVYGKDAHPLAQQVQKVTIMGESSSSISALLIKKNNIVVPYYPSILETLKFAFSTYFAFALVSYLFLRTFMVKLTEEGLLPTKIIDDVPQTT